MLLSVFNCKTSEILHAAIWSQHTMFYIWYAVFLSLGVGSFVQLLPSLLDTVHLRALSWYNKGFLLVSQWTWVKVVVTTELQESQRSCEVWADGRSWNKRWRKLGGPWVGCEKDGKEEKRSLCSFFRLFLTSACSLWRIVLLPRNSFTSITYTGCFN